MSALLPDPVAVLEDAASLLPDESHGAVALRMLAMRIHLGATEVRHAVQSLDVAEVWPGAYTPDERAAFALAREALTGEGAGDDPLDLGRALRCAPARVRSRRSVRCLCRDVLTAAKDGGAQ